MGKPNDRETDFLRIKNISKNKTSASLEKSIAKSADSSTKLCHKGLIKNCLFFADNVHFQQAAQFSKAMMKMNILFKTQVSISEI